MKTLTYNISLEREGLSSGPCPQICIREEDKNFAKSIGDTRIRKNHHKSMLAVHVMDTAPIDLTWCVFASREVEFDLCEHGYDVS